MGISISLAPEPDLEVTCRIISVEIECLCGVRQRFTHADGYIGSHALAMAAGWLERQTPEGRLWLCPACSGKS